MNKKLKLFIILLVIAGVITGTAFLLHYLKVNNREKKTVDVYPVDDLAYDPTMWSGAETLNGSVNVNNEQKIYVGATSHVAEIKVKEGDHVKAGDVLMVYDMTQQQLQLSIERTELEISRAGVEDAKNELAKLQQITPVEETTEAPTTTEEPTTSEEPTTETPTTEETTEKKTTEEETTEEETTEKKKKTTEEKTTEEEGTTEKKKKTTEEKPTTEETTEEPTTEEPTTETPTTETPTTETPTTEEPTTEEPDPDEFDDIEDEEETYTKEELEKAIAEKQSEIRSLEIEYQLDYVAYQILEFETETGEVYANFEGDVRSVLDPAAAAESGDPVITLSGEGAYVVTTSIGELSLDKYKTGTECDLFCYDNGMYYRGKVTEISEYPSEDGDYYSSKVESYYPVKIAIESTDEVLTEGMYMEITMDGPMGENAGVGQEETKKTTGLCLLQAFLKRDGNNYYVMKEVDGRIKKVYVKTGKILGGGYLIEVLDGVKYGDYIAFPYSNAVQEGLHTVQKSADELYNY